MIVARAEPQRGERRVGAENLAGFRLCSAARLQRMGAGVCTSRGLLAALLLFAAAHQTSPAVIRVACLNGLKHGYDVPNGVAAKAAARRVNSDSNLLPSDTLELVMLDATVARTMSSNAAILPDDFTALRVQFFEKTLAAEDGTISSSCPPSNISAMVGPLYSSESMLLKTVLLNDHRDWLTLSYGATSPTLSNFTEFPSFGRTIPSDFLQGQGIAGLIQSVGITRAKVWGCNDVYCQGLVSVFREAAAVAGIELDETHSNFDFGAGEKSTADAVSVLKDCTVPRTQVLLVQRPDAAAIFEAAKTFDILHSLNFVGPVSVSGITGLPTGYLGFVTGVDQMSPEFQSLQDGWTAELGTNNYPILRGGARNLLSHPYVGYAYDAVLAIANALHTMRVQGENIYDTSRLKIRMRNVTFWGASGTVRFDDNLEPAVGRYLVRNQKADGASQIIGAWDAGQIVRDNNIQIEWSSPKANNPTIECKKTCVPGSVYSSEVQDCQACAPGTYANDEVCEPCEAGKYSSIAGLTQCIPCSTGYANNTGQVQCDRCPENSQTDLGVSGTSIEQCMCKTETYRIIPGSPCKR